MHYDAYVFREGKHLLAEFPDCPGCQTFTEANEDLAHAAQEALEGWLEAHLADGKIPPRPTNHSRSPAGKKLARIPVRAGLTAALTIRWARHEAGFTQGELGRLAGVKQQQIAKLEDPDENPTLETIERVAKALGRGLNVALEDGAHVSIPAPRT
jgi:predicted RNase H-like HicB family nuclease/DNA-binding XRE family transcriptional regulator